MIIIIEGPDGGGKSTLAEQVSRQTGYPIMHRTKPKTEEEKADMLEEYIKTIRSGRNMIFDRCWYSEIVYGAVMRDASVISYPDMYSLEKLLAKTGAMVIYCTGSRVAMWTRCTKRGEDYITSKDDYFKICDAYDTLMSLPHHIPVVRYEYREV